MWCSRSVALFVAATVSLLSAQAGAQSVKEAAASKAFYNIKGGQTVLVAADSELAQRPEAIKLAGEDRSWDRNLDTWGLQAVVPPSGLVRVKDGPFIDDNVKVTSGRALGYTESLLVDPATGLVHYLLTTSGVVGHGNYVPVPVSAIELSGLDALKTQVSSGDAKIMTPYSDSALDRNFPAQQITAQVRAVEVALVPSEVVAKLAGGGGGLRDPQTSILSKKGDQIGRSVVGPQGQAIGTVSYLVLDSGSGQPADAVVAVPFAGKDANVVLPMSALAPGADGLVTSQQPAEILQMRTYTPADLVNHFGTAAGG